MTDVQRTSVYVGVALVLFALAYVTRPKATFTPQELSQEGEPLCPDLADAAVPKALEVFAYDDQLGTATPFRVQFKDKKWTIPSHHDYPADAQDRLYKTAGAIIGLRKDSFVTANKAEHADLGVVDPTVEGSASRGWGTRVTLYDEADNKVADLIFGKSVEGKSGFRYVRLAGDDSVYSVKCDDVDLSTRFADWINTDLLDMSSFDLEKIGVKDYRLVERSGGLAIDDRGSLEVIKDEKGDWRLEGLKPEEETNADKARDLANAIADLRIVGVRPKPPGLKPNLRTEQGVFLAESMARRGFYSTNRGLLSNDGEIVATTRDGLVYTVRFGGLIIGRGDEVTAGKDKEEAKKTDASKDKKDDASTAVSDIQENRFLLVSVEFDESKFPPIPDPEPKKPTASKTPDDKDARNETKKDEGDSKPADTKTTKEKNEPKSNAKQAASDDKKTEAKSASDKEAKPVEKKDDEAQKKADEEAKKKEEEERRQQEEEVKRKREERDRKIKDGKEKAEKLSRRYAGWYYVVSNEGFKKTRLTRADLAKPKEKKEDEKKDEAAKSDSKDKPETKSTETKPADMSTKDAKPAEKSAEEKSKPEVKPKSDKQTKPADKPAAKPESKPTPKSEPKTSPETKPAARPEEKSAAKPEGGASAPKGESKPTKTK
jgi:hypothetical protein